MLLQSPPSAEGSAGQVKSVQKRGSRNTGNSCLLLGSEMGRFGLKSVSLTLRTLKTKTKRQRQYRKSGQAVGAGELPGLSFLEETKAEADLVALSWPPLSVSASLVLIRQLIKSSRP